MCIIVVKPANSPMPSKETLKICFTNNSDGAGYMYRRGDTVHIVKGFFDFEALWRSLEGLQTDDDVCIHFRWATHGTISRGNCHPFPLTSSVRELQNTRAHCRLGIAHNGIIKDVHKSKEISDTMVFIKTLNTDKKITKQLSEAKGGNKFCVMTPNQTVLIGDFVYDKDLGCYFSNYGYQESEITYYYTKGENELYQSCMKCHRKTCEGCPILDFEDSKDIDNYDLLSDKEFFDNDEDDIDIDEAIILECDR